MSSLLASRCPLNRDIESMWFFLRYLGTGFGPCPLPSVASSLVIEFLGTDEHGQTPGDLQVCSYVLLDIELPFLYQGHPDYHVGKFLEVTSFTRPPAWGATGSTSCVW
eukprot:TRINITY_DN58636_c0_g1_i1.p1 TRINITY_DN58636_c0_g1~~TRINITY_DN58636_c0_g1_i1.p1  ORF type:complete len:108 (+),score=5.91 TRINITY_DN58636_c0_g1_i1:49-372(+)